MRSKIVCCAFGIGTLLCILALAGCGGGSGSAGDPAQPSISVSQNSISMQDTTASSTSKTIVINFTMSNATQLLSSGELVTTAVASGIPVEYSTSTSTETSLTDGTVKGTITIQLWAANILGAGVYQGSVAFSICHNPSSTIGCSQTVAGSPVNIPVTFTVTGAARSSATASLSISSLSLESPSSATVGPSTGAPTLTLSVMIPGPNLTFSQPANGFVAAVTYASLNQESGNLTIAFSAPGKLAPGSYSESLTINICIDQQCNHPIANSPIVLPITYTVTAAAGTNYNEQSVPILANDISWSAAQGKIYAIVSKYSTTDQETLVEIDPSSAAITRSLVLAGDPRVLSVSDDGSYAYIGFHDQNIVERVVLATFTSDLSINLGGSANTGPIYAGYLAAVPGSPRSVAVSTYANAPGLNSDNSEGVLLYDDDVLRGAPFGGTTVGPMLNSIVFGSNGSALYACEPDYENLYTLSLSGTGLSQTAVVNLGQIVFGDYLIYANGLLYDSRTRSLDPTTGKVTGSFLPAGSFGTATIAVDTSLNRAYVFFVDHPSNNGEWTIETFNLATMAPISLARTTTIVGMNQTYLRTNERIVRWGTNGLAINGELGLEILSGAFVTQ